MGMNRLQLNAEKMEFIWFIPPLRRHQFPSGQLACDTSCLSTRPWRLPGQQHVNEVARYQACVHVLRHPMTDLQHQLVSYTVNTVNVHLRLHHVKTGLLQRLISPACKDVTWTICSPSLMLPHAVGVV